VRKHVSKLAVLALLVLVANPMFAGLVPSKTAANQSLESREADLAVVREVASMDGVAQALAAQGFSQEEIDSRLAALSSEDLRSLAQNLQQVQAAGLTREQWTYIGIGALAVLLIIVLSN
jgi:sporulation-control protein spo0M